jgi:amidohydrolase
MQTDYKNQIVTEIDQQSEKLWEISTTLFNEPEIALKEYKACKLLTETLKAYGFTIETGIGGLETAFRATFGENSNTTIAILAEYDALVGLGHACGHNLIAAAAIGAGIALAALKPRINGNIQVIGTPAEEGDGGKIILANAGVFNNVDAAMMFHPASKNMVLRPSLASTELKVEFFGKASHAAAAPEEGINALDAMILTFNNINALRLTFGPKDRVAGVIFDGGEASNIIPAHTSAEFSIRSSTAKRRDVLVQQIIACAQAGAQAIGCQLKFEIAPGYKEIIPNKIIAGLFRSNLESLSRVVVDPDPYERMGSTDMGDISHLVPSIHPYLAIAPENVAGHTLEFREYCISESGKFAMLDAAKALAMTTVDLLTNPDLFIKAKDELASALKLT